MIRSFILITPRNKNSDHQRFHLTTENTKNYQMNCKPSLFRSRSGKPTGRFYLFLLKRKLRRLTDDHLIVLLSALIFLMQLLIIVTAVTAGPGSPDTEATRRVEPIPVFVQSTGSETGNPKP